MKDIEKEKILRNKKINLIIERNLSFWVSKEIIKYFSEYDVAENISQSDDVFDHLCQKFLRALKKEGKLEGIKIVNRDVYEILEQDLADNFVKKFDKEIKKQFRMILKLLRQVEKGEV